MQSQQPTPAGWGEAVSPTDKEPASAYLRGFVGALLGALVGCIPWFIVSFFAGYFVGLLGFVVGFASLFGYKLFRGAKSFAYAMTVIVACSVLAMILSNFLDVFIQIYQGVKDAIALDPDWTAAIEAGATTLMDEVWYNMARSDIIGNMLANLGIGLLIGILGIVSARGQVRAYTLSGRSPAMPEGTPAVPMQSPFSPPEGIGADTAGFSAAAAPVPSSGEEGLRGGEPAPSETAPEEQAPDTASPSISG